MTGSTVHCRVTRVEDRFCKVDILAVNDRPIQSVFIGQIQKEQVRDFDLTGVQMHL